jgi:small multidrug resistance pump
MNIYWLYLILGILFEVSGTISMKYAEGFSKLLPSVLVFVFYGCSLSLFVLVLQGFEVGVSYAIWASLGTALMSVIGIVWFKEPVSLKKIISLLLIILGILGLELL